MAKRESSDFQTFIILTLVCMVSAGVLAFVYQVTKNPIAQAEARAKEEALRIVLPTETKEIKTDSLTFNGEDFEIQTAIDKDGKAIGYALQSGTNKGYGGEIVFLVGFDIRGKINTYKIMSHLETPGLGDNLTTDEFKKQFNGKDLENFRFKVTKDGGDVEAITAATISSRAACEALEKALTMFKAYKDKSKE